MATTSELDRVTMIVLRYLRGPVFVLIFVYAVGVVGMALIPGPLVDGRTQYMSLFHAFYFFTYTATTTGFGEIPYDFSDEQRLWAIFCLYVGVVAWLYAIGSAISLVQNPHFLRALEEHRLARTVRGISDPFFLVCGFGDTGSLLARGLSDHYMGSVVLDIDEERIKALALRDYQIRMPGFCADASVPKHLINAGVRQPNCKAVLILTGDEDTNLKIAVMARYLNPETRILCRSSSTRHKEYLVGLGATTVIDPFEILAEVVTLTIISPRLHNLNSWLVRARGTQLGRPLAVPNGRWVLCGFGRMGKSLHKRFISRGIETCIIDSAAEEQAVTNQRVVMSDADFQALRDSGIESAAGIVVGTDQDSSNLGILMSARRLNPHLFTVVRQNDHENQPVFDAGHADYIVQTSLTTGRRILKHLISPLIQEFIAYLTTADPRETERAIERLEQALGDQQPRFWSLDLYGSNAGALCEILDAGECVTLRDLIRSPEDSERLLQCVPLVLQRGESVKMLPDLDERVACGDAVLLCGTERSERLLLANVNNRYTLHYLLFGVDPPRGYLFTWIDRRWGTASGR